MTVTPAGKLDRAECGRRGVAKSPVAVQSGKTTGKTTTKTTKDKVWTRLSNGLYGWRIRKVPGRNSRKPQQISSTEQNHSTNSKLIENELQQFRWVPASSVISNKVEILNTTGASIKYDQCKRKYPSYLVGAENASILGAKPKVLKTSSYQDLDGDYGDQLTNGGEIC